MDAALKAPEDWRRPGCDSRCYLVRAIRPGMLDRVLIASHDPEAHEEWGRLPAGPMGETTVVSTGSLVVDRWRRTVVSDGRPVPVSGREWEILDYFAARPDRFCTNSEMLAAIWGEFTGAHVLRVFVTRLRARLGLNARLIENRFNHGYRLRIEPPVEGETRALIATAPPAWSRRFSWCVCCRTTDLPHYGHGRCTRCRGGKRHNHIGPCGAPALPATR